LSDTEELSPLRADEIGQYRPSDEILRKARFIALTRRIVLVWENPRVYVHVGEDEDHVIVGGHYCSCEGFMRRVAQASPLACSHVYAVGIAEEVDRLRKLILSNPSELAQVVWEVLTGGLAVSLRRKLALQSEHE
jgi:predicted nucleic acid-binding Zn finger protein